VIRAQTTIYTKLSLGRRVHGIRKSWSVPYSAISTLISMKEAVGREQDRIDIQHLRMILEKDGEK
jgi:hypothetical protein